VLQLERLQGLPGRQQQVLPLVLRQLLRLMLQKERL
jgi:hypothetical protein